MKYLHSYFFLSICLSILALTACSNDEEKEPVTPTTLKTKTPEKTSAYSEVITGGSIIKGNDDFIISEKGICWSDSENPTIDDNTKTETTTSLDYTISITGLQPTTSYYIRAYINGENQTIYGDEKQITTDEAPSEVSFLPDLDENKKWIIQPEFTNEFNYSEGKSSPDFTSNWQDRFFNGWTGPGDTRYSASQSSVMDGKLVYKASIEEDNNGQSIIRTGIVSSKEKVGFPLYMEARVKISESSLASAVWLLSDDSTQEIDNLEAYGNKSNDYFSRRLHLSHHTFIRDPFQDYQPTGEETYYADDKGTQWADDYHNYGVLWLDPWTLKYYVDGELVRETPTNQIDPKGYTNGTGLNKDMYLIISAAAQPWRENQGINYFTDPSVLDPERSTMLVDWVRVYKPE
ncbi:Glycosyl hydrolases family 16 [Salegentibacter agarivorans]|uniref:Glycosyl hydrolases family 16 n=1 Tax=Salegentibacter agarivorans TaxID=345907 RepID=A0A1I2KT94_9FLAO|nr:family 16 glycosylhydrolase [Salegentibacter agarivorans]SFF68311.1 Glycosyl hydrolases family 16 [Salegentibacter agarivorans]